MADFIRQLERAFRLAHGNDQLSRETREAFLYDQLQEGLRYDLMRRPSVSGALTYRELCMAAQNEEKRQAEMQKRKQYHKDGYALRPSYRNPEKTFAQRGQTTTQPKSSPQQISKGCYTCGKPGHSYCDCKVSKTERTGHVAGRSQPPADTRKVDTTTLLLLSEGVCRQLGIVTYHPDVRPWKGRPKQMLEPGPEWLLSKNDSPSCEGRPPSTEARVPMVRVRLLQSVRVLPRQGTCVRVEIEREQLTGSILLEPGHAVEQAELQTDHGIVELEDGHTNLFVINPTGFSQRLEEGLELGTAEEVDIVLPTDMEVQMEDAEPLSSILKVETSEAACAVE